MKFKKSIIFLLLLNVSFAYSQNTSYFLINKLNTNISDCKAFEVKKIKISSKKYEYLEIDNPEFIAIKNRIDSIKRMIVEIEKSKLNNEVKKNKIAELNSQNRKLALKINTGSIGYDDIVFEKINDYVPTIDIEREIFVIDTINVVDKLKGSFITSITDLDDDDYRIVNENKMQFIKNEIVSRRLIRQFFRDDYSKLSRDLGYFQKLPVNLMDSYKLLNYKMNVENSSTSNYLIKSNENNTIYYVTNGFLEKSSIEEQTYRFLKNIEELGITLSEIEDEIYIIKNGKKSILTPEIQDELTNKKDISIIDKTNNSVTLWRNLYKQQSKIAVNLSKHIQAYKSNQMTKERSALWKKDTKDCLLIQEKINKLPFNSFHKQLDIKEIQVQSAILDIMSASQNILGI